MRGTCNKVRADMIEDCVPVQDLPAWQLLGIYTGEVQFSEYTENLSAKAEDGIGFLLYDKGRPQLLQASCTLHCLSCVCWLQKLAAW